MTANALKTPQTLMSEADFDTFNAGAPVVGWGRFDDLERELDALRPRLASPRSSERADALRRMRALEEELHTIERSRRSSSP